MKNCSSTEKAKEIRKMNTIRNAMERFCREHPNFGIPNLMKYITIANVVLWILNMVNTRVLGYMVFSPYYILHGQIWRLISFIFIPPSTSWIAFIAFYFYYFIGNTLERAWGTGMFTMYFFCGVILTILYGFLIYWIFGISFSISATYIYLSMFFSFAALYPDMQVLLFFIIPIKMKWLAVIDGVLFVLEIISASFPANLIPIVAMLNFLIFCGGDLLQAFGIQKKTKTTINFKREAAKIKRDQAASLYHHKCAVCGRTDSEYPDLQFRYCSRCAGYHCFCQDHINNHIHFKE